MIWNVMYYIYNIFIHIFRLIKHGIRLANDMIKMEYDVRLVYNNIIYIYDILPLISHWSPANGTPPLSRTSPCARANSSAFTRNRSRNGMWHGGRGGAIFQKWATAQLAQLLAMFCRGNMGKLSFEPWNIMNIMTCWIWIPLLSPTLVWP